MKICLTGILLLCFLSIHAQNLKDTIYFTNGGKLIGKIKKIKLGIVTFDPDDAEDITVQLRKLKTLAAVRKIFRVETIDNHVYFGNLLPHPGMNMTFMRTDRDSIPLYLEEISILYPFGKSIRHRFSGNLGLGFTYTKSSDFGRLNFDATISYSTKNIELTFSPSGIYTITDSSFSRDREDINFKTNYYFRRNWFATVFVAYQRNLELGLDRRYQEGFGIGNKFIKSKHVYGWGRSGFVFNQERSTEGVNSGNLVEAYGQFEMNFFRFEKPDINVLLTETFYYSLSQSGRFRNDADLNVRWKLFKDFYLSLEFYNNYDSKPPVSDNDKFDYGVVFGISYKF